MGVAEVRVEGGRREEGNVRRGRALKGSGIGDEEGGVGQERERDKEQVWRDTNGKGTQIMDGNINRDQTDGEK